jgi:chromosome partitioning protein
MTNGGKENNRRRRRLFSALRKQQASAEAPAPVEREPSTAVASGTAVIDVAPEADPEVPEPEVEVTQGPKDPAPEVDLVEAETTEAPRAPVERRGQRSVAEATAPPRPRADPVELPTDAPEPIQLPVVLAIANQKGGVGKTTTAVSLGAALAEDGYRVLIVDLDPQGNATTGMGISHRDVEHSIYDVIINDLPLEDAIEATSVKNLFVAPATIDLAGADMELIAAFSREQKLNRAITSVKEDYDFVLIDCPPSLGLLTVNALTAADDVIVPVQCEYLALEGLGQLVRSVGLVRTNLNPDLEIRGIVLTMFNSQTKLSNEVEQEVRSHFGERVYETVVPRTVRLSEAPSHGEPITVFDPTSKGARSYRMLAQEVSRGATRRSG